MPGKTKILLCLLLNILLSASVLGQANMPRTVDITNDTVTYIRLEPDQIQYFTEHDGKPLDIGDITSPPKAAAFKQLTTGEPVIIPAGQHVWMRYRIKNTMPAALDITIPQGISKAEIYISQPQGRWSRYITGYGVPHSQRDGHKRIMQVKHTIPAGSEITVYERDVDFSEQMQLSVLVGIDKNVVREAYIENDDRLAGVIWSCFLSGLFFFAAVFNLFFFYTVREKVYLVYGMLLFFVAISYMSVPFSSIVLREFPAYAYYDRFIGFALTFYLFSIVALMFMQTNKYHPGIYRVLMICSTIFIILSGLRLSLGIGSGNTMLIIIRSMRFILIGGILAIMVADLYKKRYFAKMFILANAPFIIIFTSQLILQFSYLALLSDLAIVWGVVILSWSLFARYKYLQSENARHAIEKEQERNALIAQQNEMLEKQVAERTSELTQSLSDLKQTQNQLIQSEKMASLGELTAGIAHEIQNPLNFVNNFSDVSVELLHELKEELSKGDVEEAAAIADDVTQNLEKIAHHGRRADGIVKGMLQHSRASSGQKEPTDINALADEYLRLAYHGLRAKDKSFNAELVTNFDESLPKVNIIPQDIGRVLLNLFTNAFYATQQKQSQSAAYKPVVTVSTKLVGDLVEIVVKDNGTGIPDAVKDKILQPFFTTKPTGEGTGLGLSLSYDIVVKGHGGNINIESEVGKGSEFIITLPL